MKDACQFKLRGTQVRSGESMKLIIHVQIGA